jgi:hypothetical protein
VLICKDQKNSDTLIQNLLIFSCIVFLVTYFLLKVIIIFGTSSVSIKSVDENKIYKNLNRSTSIYISLFQPPLDFWARPDPDPANGKNKNMNTIFIPNKAVAAICM